MAASAAACSAGTKMLSQPAALPNTKCARLAAYCCKYVLHRAGSAYMRCKSHQPGACNAICSLLRCTAASSRHLQPLAAAAAAAAELRQAAAAAAADEAFIQLSAAAAAAAAAQPALPHTYDVSTGTGAIRHCAFESPGEVCCQVKSQRNNTSSGHGADSGPT